MAGGMDGPLSEGSTSMLSHASSILLILGSIAQTSVMVQDFEKATPSPTVWVVNIPNENASVKLSTDNAREGKQCLKLHYRFVAEGGFQYLGVPVKTKACGARRLLTLRAVLVCQFLIRCASSSTTMSGFSIALMSSASLSTW